MSSKGKYSRGGVLSGLSQLLAVMIVLDVILDVLLLPADFVLIPIEAVIDVLVVAVYLVSALWPRKSSSRAIRSRALAAGLVVALVFLLLSTGIQVAAVPAPTAAPPPVASSPVYSAPNEARPAVGVVPAQAGSNPTWGPLCDSSSPYNCPSPNSPQSRIGSSLAYDAADGYVLMFGGGHTATGNLLNTSAYWKNGGWYPAAVAVNGPGSPSPSTLTARSNASLVYDAEDGYMLLFGGYTGGGAYSQDTFKYLAGTYTKLFPANRPQASSAACMVYVPFVTGHGGYVLLFGGKGKTNGTASNYYGYTWEYAAGAWTNVSASVGTEPSARAYSSCTYDPTDGYVLFFGGIGPTGTVLSDTFEFNPQASSTGQWASVSPAAHPEASYFSNLNYVTALNGIFLTCGANGVLASVTQLGGGCRTWQWTGGSTNNWANVSATYGFGPAGTNFPKAGYDAGMTDIPSAGYAFKWGGETSTNAVSNNSWALGNLLEVTFSQTLGEVAVGGSSEFFANATGDTTPYTYAWTSLPAGCTSTSSSTLTCSPSTAGDYPTIGAKVTAADGFNVTAAGISLMVDPSASATGSFTIGGLVATEQYGFWSIRMTGATNLLNSTLAADYNATPFVYIRYGGDTDSTNITNQSVNYLGCDYSSAGVCGTPSVNYTAFKIFCQWVHCRAIVSVPAETNDAGLAAITVRWVEQTVGFPTCSATVTGGCIGFWSIGNEPTVWNHFNIKFAKWKTTDNIGASATQFGVLTENFTKAIRSVDARTPIIGDEEDGSEPGQSQHMGSVATDSCANISAIAFHSYPGGLGIAADSAQFLSYTNLTQTSAHYEENLAMVVSGCGAHTLPAVFVNEFNGALGTSGNVWLYGSQYDATFTAAVAVQLLADGCQMQTFFDWTTSNPGSLEMIQTTGPTPAYYLYADVLEHMPIGQVYNVTVATSMQGIWAIETANATESALLLVNTNTTVSAALTPTFSFGNDQVTVYQDGVGGPQRAQTYASAPNSISVPPYDVELLVFSPAAKILKPPVSSISEAAPASDNVSGVILAVVAAAGILALAVAGLVVFSHPRGRSGRRLGR